MYLKKDITIAIILMITLIVGFLRYLIGSDTFLLVYFILTWFAALVYLLSTKDFKLSKYLPFYFIFSAIFFFAIAILLDNDQPIIFHVYTYINFLSSFLIGFLIYKNPYRLKISSYILSLFLLFFFWYAYQNGFTDIESYNNILAGASRNIVAAFILFLTVFLIATYYHEYKKVPFLYLFFVFIACLLLYGRSGIALSFFILLFFTYNRFNIYYQMTLILGLAIILLSYYNELNYFLNEYTNFNYGLKTPRTDMLKEYLSDLTIKEIFIGQSFSECCSLITSFDNNPHNSFIKGHSRYGIIHTIFFVIIFSKILLKNRTLFALGLVLLIKYSTDLMGLFAPIDFILFYLFLLTYSNQNNSIKQPHNKLNDLDLAKQKVTSYY